MIEPEAAAWFRAHPEGFGWLARRHEGAVTDWVVYGDMLRVFFVDDAEDGRDHWWRIRSARLAPGDALDLDLEGPGPVTLATIGPELFTADQLERIDRWRGYGPRFGEHGRVRPPLGDDEPA